MSDPVLVVIVNYRTPLMVVEALRSIRADAQEDLPPRTVVVDNDSGDGSFERIAGSIRENRWEGWASVSQSGRNGGFAAGNNWAIRAELGRTGGDPARYILLLNPDTVVRGGAIRTLVEFMERHPGVGIAGSQIEDPAGHIQGSGRRFPSPLGELENAARTGWVSTLLKDHSVPMIEGPEPMRCDWVSGASMMVRSRLFQELGLLDEGFFLYFEEVDFCRRASGRGWETWFVPASRVVHREGSSTGIQRGGRRRPRYWFASRRRYYGKSFGSAGWLWADLFWALGRLIWTVRRLLGVARPHGEDPLRFEYDLLWGDLRAALEEGGPPGRSGSGPGG